MQYIALNSTTIIAREEGDRLVAEAGLDHELEGVQYSCVLRARYYAGINADDGEFRWLEPSEEDLASDDNEMRLTGWKRLTALTGAAAASWGLVIACVAIARALLA